MFPKLSKSEKFKNDLEEYSFVISNIQNEKYKSRAEKTLLEYKHHCELIDNAHSAENNGVIDPRSIQSNVDQMVQLRIDLDNLVKDFYR